jgi:eukaryotic-like serine/threonine-protein kinase
MFRQNAAAFATVARLVTSCPRCSSETQGTGEFCPECGTAFVDPAAATAVIVNLEDSPATSNLVGITIGGQFSVDSVLGGGAFGTVYRGRQLGLDRPVAIKVPTSAIVADPVMAKRFAREARSAARITHPGVVAIYAVGELDDGRPYLAMEFVDGESLDKILTGGPLPPERALSIIRAISAALAETHAADVVHRDLKPSNIVWRRDRHGDDRITIVDFGIAASKPGTTADATRLTHNGLIGTPNYMSPEQAHGDDVDARSDLYAVGCLLFELVTNAPPFEGTGIEVLLAHLGRPAPVPSERHPGVPAAIDELCARLLAKKPEDRPQNADAVVEAVDAALATLRGDTRKRPKRTSMSTRVELPGANLERSVASTRQRTRRLVIASSLGAIALAAVAGIGAWTIGHHSGSAAAAVVPDEPADTPNGPVVPNGSNRRAIDEDDGELVMHVLVPDPILAGTEVRPHLEIHNKLGQPVIAQELVMTIEDDRHVTKGLSASPHKGSGHYGFSYTFPRAGHYVMRVFPPSVDSSFVIPLDVR